MLRSGLTIRHQKTHSLTTVRAIMSQPCSVSNLIHLLRLNTLLMPMILKIHTASQIQMEMSSLKMGFLLVGMNLVRELYLISERSILQAMVLIVMTQTNSSIQEPRIFAMVSTTIALMVRTMPLTN